jgi:hypothetical protein
MSHGNSRRTLLTTTGRVVKNSTFEGTPLDTDYIFAKNIALDNPLQAIYGGTGQKLYTKGDILVAQNPTTLVKLPVGDNGQVLTCDSEASNGINWSSSTSAYPRGYVEMGDPYLNGIVDARNVTYKIEYVYARSQFNDIDFRIDWRTYLSIGQILISSNNLGNASSSGTTVTGTNINSYFIVGDVIRINGEGRRIVSITNSNTLVVESAFSQNYNNQPFRRGGAAPNTTYYLYVIGDGESTSLALSTRCFANYDRGRQLVDLPSEQYYFRQLWPVFFTNTSGSDFVAFIYNNRKMISYYNPDNILNTALACTNGYYWTHNNAGNVTYLNDLQHAIPMTMSSIYIQKNSAGIVNSALSMPDNGLTLYNKNSVGFDDNGSVGKFVFIGGIVDDMNVIGED